MTTSSLRLAKWLTEYAHLMRVIRSDAGRIWSGMAELFELYFLHTFHTFGDIPITALMSPQQQRQVTSPESLWFFPALCTPCTPFTHPVTSPGHALTWSQPTSLLLTPTSVMGGSRRSCQPALQGQCIVPCSGLRS